MATRLNPGDEITFANRVTRVTAGTEFVHFVRYQAMPAGRLQHVLQKYPGHFVATEARRCLQGLPQPA